MNITSIQQSELNALTDIRKDIDETALTLKLDHSDYKSRQKELEDINTGQNIKLRKKFSWAIYGLVVGFVLLVLLIIFFAGFKLCGFYLADYVLIALITTMTTTIVGLLVFVLKYFFPEIKKD